MVGTYLPQKYAVKKLDLFFELVKETDELKTLDISFPVKVIDSLVINALGNHVRFLLRNETTHFFNYTCRLLIQSTRHYFYSQLSEVKIISLKSLLLILRVLGYMFTIDQFRRDLRI